ncbi:unnamed protein product [Bursaphelenchus okinawaensis]|uniref:Uncharacterized protein n=1 Tax=Bursaphelenchus okinawaensis TaxID=465554 RepID=A0A811KCL6_9BILA|nr:unnamed protein product [Bursaphelenchus okinawaensis]CAG9101042.1 unnamed protein product [Bursaphelenchus okinawaensis]
MAGRTILPPKIEFPGSSESLDEIDLTTSSISFRQEQNPMLVQTAHVVISDEKVETGSETTTETVYFEPSYLPFIAILLIAYSASALLQRSLPMDVAFVLCAYGIFSTYCLLRWKSVMRYVVPALLVAFVLGKTVTDLANVSVQYEKSKYQPVPNKVEPSVYIMTLAMRVVLLFLFALVYDLLGFGIVEHYKKHFKGAYRIMLFIVGWVGALTVSLVGSVSFLVFAGYAHIE